MTLTCSILLSGRLKQFLQCGCALAAAYIGSAKQSHYTLAPDVQARLTRVMVGAIGVLCVLGAAIAYLAAVRRRHIDAAAMYVAASAWVAMIALVAVAAAQHPDASVAGGIFFAGLAALVVAPFATFPLAIAWNRHR
jgi:hypothetical protein